MCKFQLGDQVLCIRTNRHRKTGTIGAVQGQRYFVKDINKCYICGAFHLDIGLDIPRDGKGYRYSSICSCREFIDAWGTWWHCESRFVKPDELLNEHLEVAEFEVAIQKI